MLTSVNGGTGALKLELVITELDLLELNLPVSLAADGNVLDLASVSIVIDTTKDGLSAIFFRGTKTEREDGSIKQALVDHAVERRCDVVD